MIPVAVLNASVSRTLDVIMTSCKLTITAEARTTIRSKKLKGDFQNLVIRV